jgi:hypothetical protein
MCNVYTNVAFRGNFSPKANYTDWATAADGEVVKTFQVSCVAWSAQRIPTAVNLGFLDRSRNFFFQELLSYPHEAERTPFQTTTT